MKLWSIALCLLAAWRKRARDDDDVAGHLPGTRNDRYGPERRPIRRRCLGRKRQRAIRTNRLQACQ